MSSSFRRALLLLSCLAHGATWVPPGSAAETRAPTAPAPTADPRSAADADELFAAGRALFDQLPAAIRAGLEFPTREQWDESLARLERALTGDSLEDLAVLTGEARAGLTALRLVRGYEDLADWFEQRLDEMEGAQQATALQPKPVPTPLPRPGTTPPRPIGPPVPHYDLWLARVKNRPLPTRAATLMPKLRAAFIAEGVPPELAWLAEAESSFNPSARSPVGAKGLFQFMPETAKSMGLSAWLPDERTDPEKSARAAARYLRSLHGKFGNWALALAAYNAGEGRVGRALAQKGAKSFTAIADALPAETRMYVPKVCALIETRAGVPPHQIGVGRSR